MPDDTAPITDTGRNEIEGMRRVPDTAQGAVIEPWVTRLKPPHPRHISIAAGALITITVSLEQAYMVAYTLHDAGLLAQETPGPFRVGGHWGVTVVQDPEQGEKTGVLWATAQTLEYADMIVSALNAFLPVPLQPGDPAEPREAVGALVRQIWVEWAREQPDPKPSWLLSWEQLDAGQREVDMRIGTALFTAGQRATTTARVELDVLRAELVRVLALKPGVPDSVIVAETESIAGQLRDLRTHQPTGCKPSSSTPSGEQP